MPAQTKTRHQVLTQLAQETRQVVVSQFPEVETALPPAVGQPANLLAKLKQAGNPKQLGFEINYEEYRATLQKLSELISQPPTDYQDEDLLYLEQQLSDLLGFSLTASLKTYQVPYIGGVAAGLPHLKRTPTDELDQHQTVLEAGLSQKRGFYGWFGSGQQHLAEAELLAEKFYFSLPINLTPAWRQDPQQTAQWFRHRKLVMINPVREIAIVGVMADIGPHNSVRAQFGASPEAIRLGEVWHPENKGRVAIFFVEDLEDQVPLGKLDLKTKLAHEYEVD